MDATKSVKWYINVTAIYELMPHAGSKFVRIGPLCFLAGCHKRQLNQFLVYVCIR